uniref:Uncharacterized protein n=1 Tax=Anopheles melas TaxID=34690 RepID=A0A182UE30_9DIPT
MKPPRTLSDLPEVCPDMQQQQQQQHHCDLQPEDLSLHSSAAHGRVENGGETCPNDDAAPSPEQARTKLSQEMENELWNAAKSLVEEDEALQCAIDADVAKAKGKQSDEPPDGRPSARESETPATTAGGIANALGSATNVTSIAAETKAAAAEATESSSEAIGKILDVATASPNGTTITITATTTTTTAVLTENDP